MWKYLAGIVLLALHTSSGLGAVVSVTLRGETIADFRGFNDADQSSLVLDDIRSYAARDNSFTESQLAWTWDGSSLSGSSTLTAEKTISARRGGTHEAQSQLFFEFTVDAETQISFAGTWGFRNASSGGDSLNLQLRSSSAVIYSDFTTSNSGLSSDSFGFSGILGPGTYTFSLSGLLTEDYRSAGSASAGWSISGFELITVPEASLGMLATISAVAYMPLRRRRGLSLIKPSW